jgi:hypothetical protein
MNGSVKPVLEINLASVRSKKHAHTLETVKHQHNTIIAGLTAHMLRDMKRNHTTRCAVHQFHLRSDKFGFCC